MSETNRRVSDVELVGGVDIEGEVVRVHVLLLQRRRLQDFLPLLKPSNLDVEGEDAKLAFREDDEARLGLNQLEEVLRHVEELKAFSLFPLSFHD